MLADLRKRIHESPARPPLSRQDSPARRSKHFLTTADIVRRYEAGETTERVGNYYGISKTRVATVLRGQGIPLRRQGLTDNQIREAADFYSASRSLAWLAARFGVSPMTISTALRRQGVHLRPRPEWGQMRNARGKRV